MNALVSATHTQGFALVPRNMQEAMDLAGMMAKAGFLAKELQNPGGALFVIEQAMRWNMSPFAVAMETSFIQGKPMFSGKIVAAAVTSSGAITGRLTYEYSGTDDARQVVVSGTINRELDPRTITVALRDARTQNKAWTTQPDQQLAYHGSRVWARRHAPEVMLGVYSPEELEPEQPREVPNLARDEPHPRPPPPLAAAVAAAKATLPIVSPRTTKEVQVPASRYLESVERALAQLEDAGALNKWCLSMVSCLAEVRAFDDALAHQTEMLAEGRALQLAGPPDEEPEPGATEPEEEVA